MRINGVDVLTAIQVAASVTLLSCGAVSLAVVFAALVGHVLR